MPEDKYQISIKANFINILLLEDELKYFDLILSKPINGMESWIEKLRATRSVFLPLHNLKDLTTKLNIQNQPEFSKLTRALRKRLEFSNHFRNKGIGHLDSTLLERAVQWHPFVFVDTGNETDELRLADAHRAIIESCINSFVDKEGVQKEFGHEVDLAYPKDANEFYGYLKSIVEDSLQWLLNAKAILKSKIKFHTKEDIFELASVAGATNFNLREDSNLEFSESESKVMISKGLDELEADGLDKKTITLLKSKFEI